MTAVNEYFKAKLEAVPKVREYMASMSATVAG
jgi:hypothetical protein